MDKMDGTDEMDSEHRWRRFPKSVLVSSGSFPVPNPYQNRKNERNPFDRQSAFDTLPARFQA